MKVFIYMSFIQNSSTFRYLQPGVPTFDHSPYLFFHRDKRDNRDNRWKPAWLSGKCWPNYHAGIGTAPGHAGTQIRRTYQGGALLGCSASIGRESHPLALSRCRAYVGTVFRARALLKNRAIDTLPHPSERGKKYKIDARLLLSVTQRYTLWP
jgi:hypothetical protein